MDKTSKLRGNLNRQSNVDKSVLQTDEAVFGEIKQSEGTRIIAKPININNIYPDWSQPRRTIPSALRVRWQKREISTGEVLREWQQLAGNEAGYEIDLIQYLTSNDTKRGKQAEEDKSEDSELSSIGQSLLSLADLAASIRREGLTNPITVIKADRQYQIETGERRWLAYQLLDTFLADEDWKKIPARIVTKHDLWRQASENNARDNLNAVSRARQLALLIMDLHGWENFSPLEAFEHEQDFYAQIADGNEWRIPRGKGEQLMSAMGLSDATQLRQYRGILRCPKDFWSYADDYNLSERQIRDAAQKGYTVTPVTVKQENKPETSHLFQTANKVSYSKMEKLFTLSQEGNEKAKEELVGIIHQQQEWLEALLTEIEKNKR